MKELLTALLPEIILTAAACLLFLFGIKASRTLRQAAPIVALLALTAAVLCVLYGPQANPVIADSTGTVRLTDFALYIKLLSGVIAAILLLLQWPTNKEVTGNRSLSLGVDLPEYFGFFLLSIAGIFLVAGANDIILLFLGIELAAIPTYVMVSISRPLPVAQEAGLKYFFLGAMAAAILMFGLAYLFGTTGTLSLHEMAGQFHSTGGLVTLSTWQLLAAVMIFMGIAFKLAAFPFHFYAGDVYTGAATPLTALLSFVPKIAGIAALVKILYVFGGGQWLVPHNLVTLLWVMAILTMTLGNLLGLMQANIKRVMACSSIAHSGYMLGGLAVLAGAGDTLYGTEALQGVMFYIAAYGIMNVGLFGVLMMLPAKPDPFAARLQGSGVVPSSIPPATTAETFEDIAGLGRRHPALGLAMAACCFSLIGLPLTVGFLGKYYLIRPALEAGWYGLVIVLVLNAAVSAGYYLRIVAAMFLRIASEQSTAPFSPKTRCANECSAGECLKTVPLVLAVCISALGSIVLGAYLPATNALSNAARSATTVDTLRAAAAPIIQHRP